MLAFNGRYVINRVTTSLSLKPEPHVYISLYAFQKFWEILKMKIKKVLKVFFYFTIQNVKDPDRIYTLKKFKNCSIMINLVFNFYPLQLLYIFVIKLEKKPHHQRKLKTLIFEKLI